MSAHRNGKRSPVAALIAVAALGWSVSPALSEDAPNQGAAPQQSNDTVNEIQAPPAPPAAEPALPPSEIFYLERDPVAPEDKGSVYTDMGAGIPAAAPNDYEAMKLALAREAIERARSLGLLESTRTIEPPTVTPTEELQRQKMERLLTTPPVHVGTDPVAGVGDVPPPIQVMGPGTLSPAEIEKLEQSQTPTAAPAPAEEE